MLAEDEQNLGFYWKLIGHTREAEKEGNKNQNVRVRGERS